MDAEEPSVRMPPAVRPPLATLVASVAGRVTHTEPHRIFTTLARHRQLFRRWLPLGDMLLLRCDLPRRDAELLVLRTAWNCGCWYEWVQHAGIAVSHGLTGADVAAIPDWRSTGMWSPRQQLLLAAADELHRDRVITDATWAALAAELRETELIELCFLVGHYEMLAMTLNSLGVRPEPSATRLLEGRAGEVAEVLRGALVSRRGRSSPASSRHAGR
jgi:alkylhydroperoxidase family enzyme